MPKALKPVRQRDLVQRLAEVLIQSGVTIEEALLAFHRALLEAALAEGGGSQLLTAQQQKMPRTTLRNQMVICGLLPSLAHQNIGCAPGAEDLPERYPTSAPGNDSESETDTPKGGSVNG